MDGVLASYVIYIYNIGMFQSCRRLCFRTEFGDKIHIFGKLLLEDFDSHKASQGMVFCLIDVRHAAGTDFSNNLISICNIDSLF